MSKWKTRSYRINQTIRFIREKENGQRGGSDGSITDAIETLVRGLTGAQSDRLSDALAHGAYRNAKPGIRTRGDARRQANQARENEADERQLRRALILVYTVKSTRPFDVALNAAIQATGQITAAGIFDLHARLGHELTNTLARIAGVRLQIMQRQWQGWDQQVYRPLRAGAAIGQRGEPGPGTLGCFVERNGEIFILSNLHVLRQNHNGDDEIIQPPHMVGGSYLDVVADYVDGETTLDAAIARVRRGVQVQNRTTGAGAFDIQGHVVGTVTGQQILKCGCSTGQRRGLVNDANPFQTPPRNMHGIGVTNHQIKVERDPVNDQQANVDFQVQGDSGTAICDLNGAVLGLLNVKHPTDGTALATLIDPILQRFNVNILAAGVHQAPGRLGNLVNFRTRSITPGASGNIIHELEWDSSTGDLEDLHHIQVREHVSWPDPPNPALHYIIDPEPLENYHRRGEHFGVGNAATSPGTGGEARDEHGAIGLFKPGITRITAANTFAVTFQQVYEMRVGAANWAPIPGSQYTVRRAVTVEAGNRVRITLTKTNVGNPADSLSNSVLL